MLTKLTLTIDYGVIDRAKKYAHNKNKSVSRLVEEFLDVISDDSVEPVSVKKLESPLTDSIVGMFKDSGKSYKDLLGDALMDVYQ